MRDDWAGLYIANVAIDKDGQYMPYSPEQVDGIIADIMNKGDILGVIAMVGDNLAVQFFRPPSEEMCSILDQAAAAYRKSLTSVKGTKQ